MSFLDEPFSDLPCIMSATEDEWFSIEIKLDTIDEDSVKLPSGKKVPQLIMQTRDCQYCGEDSEHQIPFWAMKAFHTTMSAQSKRKGWIEMQYCRSILPDGKNKADFRLERD